VCVCERESTSRVRESVCKREKVLRDAVLRRERVCVCVRERVHRDAVLH